ncbi:MAG TPA: ComEC/Rec2 family competence protein [Candidatus Paceibacterota bacterium]
MAVHRLAFWFCAFFLLGVLLQSISGNFILVTGAAILAAFYFLAFQRYAFALLMLLLLIGGGYTAWRDAQKQRQIASLQSRTEFHGVIRNIEYTEGSQKILLALDGAIIRVTARRYPSLTYGDEITVRGAIREDLILFPQISRINTEQGNWVIAQLLQLRDKVLTVLKQSLPSEEASFLAGITLGARESFSKELQNDLKQSGTTHLVALSGYNIAVIAATISFMGFWFTVAVIILFVLMTGAAASVVRAAIMGIIILLAQRVERRYSLRNAIAVAAFLMVLWNPRVLVFDIGFQLSFAALLGIVYVAPALKNIFRIENAGLLSWKENIVMTIAAQLAVLPLLLGYFGSVSVTSVLANVLVVGAMPLTMAFGFTLGGAGLFFNTFGNIIGWLVHPLLVYELAVIRFFSHYALPISVTSFSIFAGIVYYSGLIYFTIWNQKRN